MKYHIIFKIGPGRSTEETGNWLFNRVAHLSFSGKHSYLEWTSSGYAVNTLDDLTLLLLSSGEYVKCVVDTEANSGAGSIVFGNF